MLAPRPAVPTSGDVSADFEAPFCPIGPGRTICLEEYSLTRPTYVKLARWRLMSGLPAP